MRANDAIAGVVLIILSIVMIALTASFPDFPGQKYGPSLFPRILSAGLIVCGGILIWNGLTARRMGAPWVELAPWVKEPRRLATFFLVLVLLLLYIFAAETVGFIPLALLFLVTLFLWLGVRPWIAAVTALVGTFAIYWFFATLLRVPLPRGWLNLIL
ncbi:tripartite tricarboxylate transporter TctB family protein [Bradyrhizobium sp. PUT101]|uniref:tripartite tricarboxylate transporter TctB family protein n=1 Tax=Bradyrhizobium sp. PUT101 TaxID=3447427 RepID=UPI003F87F4F2